MGKRSQERRLSATEAMAVAGRLRTSPQKLNLVAKLIRGLPAERALTQLKYSPRRIAGEVRTVLQSAIANAENNHNLDVDRLIVAAAYGGKSLVMKRFRPRARGRGAQIIKPFSRMTVVVREQGEE